MAVRLLAFPCGIIRGVLGNLGIPAVVSGDFLADGTNMASCSFNIKVK
jgi:trafficking protein particle complex subunit 6